MKRNDEKFEPVIDALLNEALGGEKAPDLSTQILERAEAMRQKQAQSSQIENENWEESTGTLHHLSPRALSQRSYYIAATLAALLCLGAVFLLSDSDKAPENLESNSNSSSINAGNEKDSFENPQERASALRLAMKEIEKDLHAIEALQGDGHFALASLPVRYFQQSNSFPLHPQPTADGRVQLSLPDHAGGARQGDLLFVPSTFNGLDIGGLDIGDLGTLRSDGPVLLHFGAAPSREELRNKIPLLNSIISLDESGEKGLYDMKNWKRVGAFSVLTLAGSAIFGGQEVHAQDFKPALQVKIEADELIKKFADKSFADRDSDSDGSLSKEEAGEAMLALLDSDRDGKISKAEWGELYKNAVDSKDVKVVKRIKIVDGEVVEDVEEVIEKGDLSDEAKKKIAEEIAKKLKEGAGKIGGARVVESSKFEDLDTNGDGFVDESEFTKDMPFGGADIWKTFSKVMDKNGDGKLSKDEMGKFQTMKSTDSSKSSDSSSDSSKQSSKSSDSSKSESKNESKSSAKSESKG